MTARPPNHSARSLTASPGALSEGELLAGLRRGDERALREFLGRFQPTLSARARRFGIATASQDELVADVLHDVALSLMRRSRPLTRSMMSYLNAALRNRLSNGRRARERRARHEIDAAVARDEPAPTPPRRSALAGGPFEYPHFESRDEPGSVVLSLVSESCIHASYGPGWEAEHQTAVMIRLTMALDSEMSADERRLLTYVSAFVPTREIANAFGITRTAAKTRLFRLRKRLKDFALKFAQGVSVSERLHLMRYYRRAGIVSATRHTEAWRHSEPWMVLPAPVVDTPASVAEDSTIHDGETP